MIRTAASNTKLSEGMKHYWANSPNAEMHRAAIRRTNTKYNYRPNKFRASGFYLENKFILAPQGLRRCKGCDQVKSLEFFWLADAKKGSGRLWKCKDCAAMKQKLERKPDKNIAGKLARSERWRMAHPELAKARTIESIKKNPLPRIEAARRRRLRKSQNGVFRISINDLIQLSIRQDGLCYLCRHPLCVPELDHIIPVKRGGRHSIGNVAWACRKCNRDKGFRLLAEVRYGSRRHTAL